MQKKKHPNIEQDHVYISEWDTQTQISEHRGEHKRADNYTCNDLGPTVNQYINSIQHIIPTLPA